MQLPKNVMQYGEIDPHIKIYMEDYVHTFLEQSRRPEVYLVFGKKEDRGDVSCYMIYGVERKSDWDRGSYPYFKKYERLGVMDGPADRRVFRPTRGNSAALDGYFVFYEQNEDMQSYMIAVKERDSIPGSEEKEEVMEAVRLRRELRRQGDGENQEQKDGGKDVGAEDGRAEQRQTLTAERDVSAGNTAMEEKAGRSAKKAARGERRMAAKRKRAAKASGRRQKGSERERVQVFRSRAAFSGPAGRSAKALRRAEKKARRSAPVRMPETVRRTASNRSWTVPQLCRLGCIVLALLLVAVGLTSVNRYPDMVAVTKLFSEAVGAIRGVRGGQKEEANGQSSLIVEETRLETEEAQDVLPEAGTETAGTAVTDGNGSDTSASGLEGLISQAGAEVNWRIGRGGSETETPAEEPADKLEEESSGGSPEESAKGFAAAPETESEESAGETESVQQALARPTTYIVKRGDNLAAISRRFYGSDEMVREICALNEIKNPDQIVPGQNILLP